MKKFLPFTMMLAIIASCSTTNLPTVPKNIIPENKEFVQFSEDKNVQPEKHEIHWTYDGENGPDYWGNLKAEYTSCKYGKKQSPINIDSTKSVSAKAQKLKFDYKEVPLKLINNGHTIQVNYPAGSKLTVGSVEYELLQFHFHSPSEHKIDKSGFPMEVHLVHKKADGNLGVIGIFFKEGKENEFLKKIWSEISDKESEEKTIENVKINVSYLLPVKKEYFNYEGSLTTPGCSEIVNWMVLKDNIEASKEQIETFSKLFHSNNARPVQALNDRVVKSLS